jgi:pSer/pThr/pTyr-binding forkhead associated (FHA) protein
MFDPSDADKTQPPAASRQAHIPRSEAPATVSDPTYGELIPMGGGDAIPLLKKSLLVGRRESCDIVLRFGNISAHHCQLTVNGGYWYIRDLKSLNGTKVNNLPVTEKRLQPGDTISFAKHRYRVQYAPRDLGAVGPPPPDEPVEELFGKSLLERAGLEHRETRRKGPRRYEVTDDRPGQIKKSGDPNP